MSKKVAVVTGANKGIGLAIVRGLCKAGYSGDILLTARNEKLGLESLELVKSEGHKNVHFHQLDIRVQSSCLELKKFLEKNYGGLDVLVNNAGIAFKVTATEPFGEQAEVTMRTNFWGTLWVCQALFPLLRPNARVVNVSSFVSKRSLDNCSPELQAKFRSTEISEEELCLLMGEFVIDAQNGDHKAKGWPDTAYGTTKIGVTVLSRIQARVINETRAGDGISSMHVVQAGSEQTWLDQKPRKAQKKELKPRSTWLYCQKEPKSHMDSWFGTKPCRSGSK